MNKRLVIVSTLDSNQPFGAFTRPFHLGEHLIKYFDVCQLGLECSAVNYAPSVSVRKRSLTSYIRAVQQCLNEFHPDIIYAQETLPALAALIALTLTRANKCSLVFDFHTFSAFEYWSRLSSVANPFNEFMQLIKTYIAQGLLVFYCNKIISAGQSTPDLIKQWYAKTSPNIHCVGNGVTENILNTEVICKTNPYETVIPAKIVVVVAPKTFQFPTNDMSVLMTIEIAKYLEKNKEVHFVVIGRNADDIKIELPPNITFAGFLARREDFDTYLKYADIALLPFPKQAVAGGARNKALDYFASKKLVISTSEGLRGLEEFHHMKHLLVAGYSTQEMAEVILNAALNLDKYQSLAEAAYTLIRDKYSWNAKAKNIARILMANIK